MMKSERLVLFLLAFLLYASLSASPARADRVDDYVREQMRLRHVPGLALAVVRDGRVIKESGYGLASVELEVPVSSSTVFEIGSISKQITAAAVMKRRSSFLRRLLVPQQRNGADSQAAQTRQGRRKRRDPGNTGNYIAELHVARKSLHVRLQRRHLLNLLLALNEAGKTARSACSRPVKHGC